MKVALCIPCHADPKADFTTCLARLINETHRTAPGMDLEIFMARSATLMQSRQWLVEWARDWGASHMLWLDADHTFHPHALLKLLARKADIVGTAYRRRDGTIMSTAATETADGWVPVLPTAEKASKDELEEVHRIGLGLALMDMKALAVVVPPLFETRSEPGGGFISEDVLLCDKLRAAGFKIYVDHRLSMTVGHIYETVLTFPPKTVAVPV